MACCIIVTAITTPTLLYRGAYPPGRNIRRRYQRTTGATSSLLRAQKIKCVGAKRRLNVSIIIARRNLSIYSRIHDMMYIIILSVYLASYIVFRCMSVLHRGYIYF